MDPNLVAVIVFGIVCLVLFPFAGGGDSPGGPLNGRPPRYRPDLDLDEDGRKRRYAR